MVEYFKLFGDLPKGDCEACVAFLEQEPRYELTAAYEQDLGDGVDSPRRQKATTPS